MRSLIRVCEKNYFREVRERGVETTRWVVCAGNSFNQTDSNFGRLQKLQMPGF
ncbi:hypothetical protein [Calothrix sp. NIES-3974]|uniref:hypothetical protein n=1 Tax=Calothrix sp. NIES-3974 TaxID=2005462 RepID=UPI0012FD5645|nr:hypothetical protein [Calothrix sp. NIES-3974]